MPLRYLAPSLTLVCMLSLSLAVRAQEPAATQPTPPVLPETRVEATPPLTPVIAEDSGLTGTILDGTIFDSPPVIGYRADSSTSGTIINVPDADLPATVNVVPRDVLDDQNVLRFDDIIRDAGGVTPAGDGLFADRIFLRGLEVGSRNFRKDGFLDPTFVPRDFQNVERVEILKGPASVLYGAGDPAGLVNHHEKAGQRPLCQLRLHLRRLGPCPVYARRQRLRHAIGKRALPPQRRPGRC